ncbi:MAG TPA: AI-2E family transporter [Actinomycetota bacterium]|jgi:predicted PurR-regulated permease PerM
MPDDLNLPRWLRLSGAWGWRLVAVTGAFVIIGYLILKVAVIVVAVLLACFLAAVLEPLARRLRDRGLKPALAAAIVFLSVIAVLAGVVSWIGISVADQMDDVVARSEQGLEDIQEWLSSEFGISDEQLDRLQDQFTSGLGSVGTGGIARSVIGGARLAVEVVGGFLLMLFTLFFLLKDGWKASAWAEKWVPGNIRQDLVATMRNASVVLRRYFLAIGLTGLVDGVLMAIALLLIGVPLVGPLAVLTFLGAFIPIIGAFAAGTVATLVALVTNGPGDAFLVLAATVAIQQVEGQILQPFIFGPVIKMHELMIVLAVAAGLTVGGIVGAFLAVPIVALIAETARYYRGQSDLAAVSASSEDEGAVTKDAEEDAGEPAAPTPTSERLAE